MKARGSLSLFEAARRNPSAVAVLGAAAPISYSALADRVSEAMTELAATGVFERKAPVGLVARPTVASLLVLLALTEGRVPLVLIHPRTPERERDSLLSRVGANLCWVPDAHGLDPIVGPEAAVLSTFRERNVFVVVPTSGSTGLPKLVVLERAAIHAASMAAVDQVSLAQHDRWLLCLPLAHVGGLSIVTRSLLACSAMVLFEAGESGLLRAAPKLAKALVDHQVTLASLVPTLLDAILAQDPEWRPPPTLRAVILGGAALSPKLLERALARGVAAITTYGLTESCSQVTALPLDAAHRVRKGIVSAGRALDGVEVAFDADQRIRVRAPSLCSGFLGASAPIDAEGWFQTDDRGWLDQDGYLYVIGRASDRIVTGGENVDPLRVEAILEAIPGVLAACVFGLPDERFGEIVACALVCGDGFARAQFDAQIRLELAKHEVPRTIAIVPELSRLPNGKLDRAATRRAAEAKLEAQSRV